MMAGEGQVVPLPRPGMRWLEVIRRMRQVRVRAALEAIKMDPGRCPLCGASLAFRAAGRFASCPRCPVQGYAIDLIRIAKRAGYREALRILAPLAGLAPDEVRAAHSLHVAERRHEPRGTRGELVERGRRWLSAVTASEAAADLLATMKTEVEEALRDLAQVPGARSWPPATEPQLRGGP